MEHEKDLKDIQDLKPQIGEIRLKRCSMCHRDFTFKVFAEDFLKWKQGTSIQEAMPYLHPDIRELLISGVCGKCFDRMFENGEY